MQIRTITLKNIKSHRDLELDFVSGINVLSGPNGVGKSTVFEAIGYALFGVDARDFVGNIERFLSIGAKKGEITVTFSLDNGEVYRVSRGVGSGSKWLLSGRTGDTFEVEEHASAHETEHRIKELLGLDSGRSLADQYKMVIGPFQHEFLGPFVLKQPVKRQEAFDEILGIDAWRKTYKGTSTLLAAVKNKIEIIYVEMKGKEEQAALLPEREKDVKDLLEEKDKQQLILDDLEKQLNMTGKQLADLDKQEKNIQAVTTDIQVVTNRLQDGEEKIAEQKRRVAEAEKAVAVLEKNRTGKEAYEEAENNLKSLRESESRRKKIEKDLLLLDKESSRLAQNYSHELAETGKIDKQLVEEAKHLQQIRNNLGTENKEFQAADNLEKLRQAAETLRSSLGVLQGKRSGLAEGQEKLAEGICPFFKETCLNVAGKEPQETFTVKIEKLDREIETQEKRLEKLNSDMLSAEQNRAKKEAAKVRIQELDKQIRALTEKREQNRVRQQQLAGLEKLKNEAERKASTCREELHQFRELDAQLSQFEKIRLQNQAARDSWFAHRKDALDLDNRQKSLDSMLKLYEELKLTLARKKQEVTLLEKNYNAKHHEEMRLAREKMLTEKAARKQQIESLDKDRHRLEEEIGKLKQIKEQIKVLQAEKKSLAEKEELVSFLRTKIFNNVSAQLSERFREEISLRADTIYRTIAETDEELYWGDRYQIILRDMENGSIRERSDDQLSGGQIMSAVVALRLALLQTIGAKIAFFDEPTSNLDAERRENLAHAFRAIEVGREEVTEHWYDQLFLISHDFAFTEITDQVIQLGDD